MSNKFHQSALTDYTRSYARRVCADFFSNHTVISGKQILNLTPIGQLNMFIVSNLFDKWKADAEKFRSPYFDFAQPDVEEAMRSFMNVVSQHIAVRRHRHEARFRHPGKHPDRKAGRYSEFAFHVERRLVQAGLQSFLRARGCAASYTCASRWKSSEV